MMCVPVSSLSSAPIDQTTQISLLVPIFFNTIPPPCPSTSLAKHPASFASAWIQHCRQNKSHLRHCTGSGVSNRNDSHLFTAEDSKSPHGLGHLVWCVRRRALPLQTNERFEEDQYERHPIKQTNHNTCIYLHAHVTDISYYIYRERYSHFTPLFKCATNHKQQKPFSGS